MFTSLLRLTVHNNRIQTLQYLSTVPGHGSIDELEAARALAEPSVRTEVITGYRETE